MAARRTSQQQTPPATEMVELGTFVSATPVGYVACSAQEIEAITRLIRHTTVGEVNKAFFNNLLIIKTLAPEASRDLLVYPTPMVIDFVSKLRHRLALTYYNGRS